MLPISDSWGRGSLLRTIQFTPGHPNFQRYECPTQSAWAIPRMYDFPTQATSRYWI